MIRTALPQALVTTRGHLLPTRDHRQQGWAGGAQGTLVATEPMGPRSLQAITRKFVPLDQWLYFDALECLAPEGAAQLAEEDCAPVRARAETLPGTGQPRAPALTRLLRLRRGALATMARSPFSGPPSRSSWAARSTWW